MTTKEIYPCEVCNQPKPSRGYTTCGAEGCKTVYFYTKTPEYDASILELRFRNDEERADFLSRHINSGEQHIECYTKRWSRKNEWAEIDVITEGTDFA